MSNQAKVAGRWVPSIPLPLYGLRKRCRCGRRFWTADGYQGHYLLQHVYRKAAVDPANQFRWGRDYIRRRYGGRPGSAP